MLQLFYENLDQTNKIGKRDFPKVETPEPAVFPTMAPIVLRNVESTSRRLRLIHMDLIQREPLPDMPLCEGVSYILVGDPTKYPVYYKSPSAPCLRFIFDGYYHNEVGYCMQRFRDVVHCASFEPLDLYNPAVSKMEFGSDYSCVRVMKMRYSCIPAKRFSEPEKQELIRRARTLRRHHLERALRGTIAPSKTFEAFLPPELARIISDFACDAVV